MYLVVVGASTGVGQHLVRLAQARGHQVTAVTSEDEAELDVPGARVARGDLASGDFLCGAFRHSDAVISALEVAPLRASQVLRLSEPGPLSRMTAAVVAAMRVARVDRLFAVSAAGAGDSAAVIPAAHRCLARWTPRRFWFDELGRMEAIAGASGLEVCVPRPSMLSGGAATGRVVVAQRLAARSSIPREDVASWMLDEVVRRNFTAVAPVITVTGAC